MLSPRGERSTHMKGGLCNDGRFATVPNVINHYEAHFKLGLAGPEINNLVEYLKSGVFAQRPEQVQSRLKQPKRPSDYFQIGRPIGP
jgi:hypothetical protein